jgi:hypothetical protein
MQIIYQAQKVPIYSLRDYVPRGLGSSEFWKDGARKLDAGWSANEVVPDARGWGGE